MVIAFVRVLLRLWEKEEGGKEIQTMKLQMLQFLKSRFTGIEHNKLLCLATLHDHRFIQIFVNHIITASAKDMLEEELEANSAEESEVSLELKVKMIQHRHPHPNDKT